VAEKEIVLKIIAYNIRRIIIINDSGFISIIFRFSTQLLDEKTINERAKKVLELVSKSLAYKGHKASNNPDLEAHAKIAYEAAIEGFVLLKNDNALLISKGAKLALFGLGSYMTVKGGLGSGDVNSRYVISISEGLKEKGVKIDEELERIYVSYKNHPDFGIIQYYSSRFNDFLNVIRKGREHLTLFPRDSLEFIQYILQTSYALASSCGVNVELELEDSLIEEVAKEDDIAIITISRISGEGWDRMPVKGDFYLTDENKN